MALPPWMCIGVALAALLGGCVRSSATTRPGDEPVTQTIASSPDRGDEAVCAEGKITPCACAAGKGYRLCTDGWLGPCVCERPGDVTATVTHELGPPTAGDLALYTRDIKGTGDLMVELQTSMGDIHCTLYERDTPMTVANFVGLARGLKAWKHPETGGVTTSKLYDGTTFHRVIPNFMIQGGDPLGTGIGKPGYMFDDEIVPSLRHDRPGVLAMANQGPNTNGCQFYITEKATPWLDGKFTIFGQCQEIALVKQIARVPVERGQHGAMHQPKDPITITRVRIYRQ